MSSYPSLPKPGASFWITLILNKLIRSSKRDGEMNTSLRGPAESAVIVTGNADSEM
jgi:hypothetical protein